MQVLFIVLNSGQHVKEIVERMRELGVKGATIIDTMGSGRYQEAGYSEIPIIGGFMNALNPGIVNNKTIFSVIEDKALLRRVADEVEKILGGDMGVPGTGILFSVPVDMIRGGSFNRNTE